MAIRNVCDCTNSFHVCIWCICSQPTISEFIMDILDLTCWNCLLTKNQCKQHSTTVICLHSHWHIHVILKPLYRHFLCSYGMINLQKYWYLFIIFPDGCQTYHSGQWLSYTGCWQSLHVMYLILVFGMLFLFLTTSLGCFCPRIFLFE